MLNIKKKASGDDEENWEYLSGIFRCFQEIKLKFFIGFNVSIWLPQKCECFFHEGEVSGVESSVTRFCTNSTKFGHSSFKTKQNEEKAKTGKICFLLAFSVKRKSGLFG